jgi:hypothetical protein
MDIAQRIAAVVALYGELDMNYGAVAGDAYP